MPNKKLPVGDLASPEFLINIEQTKSKLQHRLSFMSDSVSIVTATRDGDDGLIVTFSDGTITAYVAEELLELRPHRELIRLPRFTENKSVICEKLTRL